MILRPNRWRENAAGNKEEAAAERSIAHKKGAAEGSSQAAAECSGFAAIVTIKSSYVALLPAIDDGRLQPLVTNTADGRTRTGTGRLSPTDFKSVASAISPHRRAHEVYPARRVDQQFSEHLPTSARSRLFVIYIRTGASSGVFASRW